MKDFLDAFRDLKQQDLNNLLHELKRAGKVSHEGHRRIFADKISTIK